MNEITSDRTALFLQRGMGSAPMFRGLHAFTGDMMKSDGTITPVYHHDAGRQVAIGRTRAAPELVTISIDASLRAIGDLVGDRTDGPLHLAMVADSCLPSDLMRSWGRWGATEPQLIMLIPDARVEQRTLRNLMSRDDGGDIPIGSVQIKFDRWALIKGGVEVAIQDVTVNASPNGALVALAHSSSLDCDELDSGSPDTDIAWYAAQLSGALWRRSGDGGWSVVSATSPWVSSNAGIYVDNRFMLLGGSDGVHGAFGVRRTTNGGATWTKVVFGISAIGVEDQVRQIVRCNDDFIAFTSNGIWRSVDFGRSWIVARAGASKHGVFDVTGLGISVNLSKIFVSRDSGLKWTEVTRFGTHQGDGAFSEGYIHVVDEVAGYARADISAVRNGNTIEWEVKDDTPGITRIVFANSQLGYRLRGTAIDRTLNGGYSWETLSMDDTAAPFSNLSCCGGRLGVIGERYFGYYSPFFDGEA